MNFFDNFTNYNLIAAHRGYSFKYPENSMIAFKKSIFKSDFIECDIRLTKDGIPIIFHDDDLYRTSNIREKKDLLKKGFLVKDFLYDELLELDISSWFSSDENFSIKYILSLDDILKFAISNNIYLNLEIKDMSSIDYDFDILVKILDIIEKNSCQNRVLISSFNHNYLKRVKSINPIINIAALDYEVYSSSDILAYLKSLDVVSYHIDFSLVNKTLVNELLENNIFTNVYTINDKSIRKDLFNIGIKSIFTDIL